MKRTFRRASASSRAHPAAIAPTTDSRHGLAVCHNRWRGDCRDNAAAESFFATLKLELVYQVQWRTCAEPRTAIFEYPELFYNRHRRHSSLGYLSPAQFELSNYQRLAA